MVILIFLVQFVLAIPNKIIYGSDNLAATKLSTKIALALLVVNVAGAIFILYLNAPVPVQFGYYHVVFSLAILYLILKRISSNGLAWVK